MDFNYFDLAAASIILLLGLKGIINGFSKELFGLAGIIGGIFVASRISHEVGQRLSDLIFKFDNSAAINFTGFIVTFAAIWIIMILIGSMFTKLSRMSGLGIIDKLFGFIFGAGKFFLIASVIAYATYNIKAIKSTLDSSLQTSVLFPIFVSTGAYIMKMDPAELTQGIEESIHDANTKITESLDKNIPEKIKEIKDELQGSK